jgi:hypothetical protein
MLILRHTYTQNTRTANMGVKTKADHFEPKDRKRRDQKEAKEHGNSLSSNGYSCVGYLNGIVSIWCSHD